MLRVHGPAATASMRQELGYNGFIIGATGFTSETELAAFTASGINAVLTKPVTTAKFVNTLTDLGLIARK